MGTAQDLITDARGFASSTLEDARSALADSQSSIANIANFGIITDINVDLPSLPEGFDLLAPPNLIDVEFSPPPAPDTTVTGELPLPELLIPSAPIRGDITKPDITLPDKPGDLPVFSAIAPDIDLDLKFPDVPPEFVVPRAPTPTVGDYPVPVKPVVTTPEFSAVLPTDNTVAPTDLDTKFETAYRDISPVMVASLEGQLDAYLTKINPQYHTQLAALETKLTDYLAGGTALSESVENAIYERSKDKNNAEAIRTQTTAFDDAARRGFSIPPITAIAAVNRARQGAADNNARAGVEIAIKQAELEQQNLQFAITTSATLRNAALQASIAYHQSLVVINGQALEFSKNILQAVVEIFNLSLQAFASRLEVYKAEAGVFETKLRATLATIQIYQAEIDAFKALTDVDVAKINAHRASIDVLSALSSVYRAQIDGVLGQARLEAAKVDVFQSQVQAFSSQVDAKNAEWSSYRAEINGEEAKVRLFGAEVAAFNSEMQAFSTEVDAKATIVKTISDHNKSQVEKVNLEVDTYKALVSSLSEVTSARLENQRQQLTAFQIESTAAINNAQLELDRFKSLADVRIKEAELAVIGITRSADTEIAAGHAMASASTANGQVFSNVAGAAMAGMNSLATVNEDV